MLKTLTIISDCRDDNARARQEIRYKSLIGDVAPIFIGVESDLEAAGNLIDAIDAHKGNAGVIIVNVAPRGNKEKYPNGIPFCYHRFGELIIIGTPNCFSLAKKLGLFQTTNETDVLTACSKFLPEEEALRISQSQFRSYEYLPYLAKWLLDEQDVPAQEFKIEDFGTENFVWEVDCFGNCKTTMLSESDKSDKYKDLKFYERLADVPKDGTPALTRGSSGYGDNRFIEIVIQREPVNKKLGLEIGSRV